VSKIVEIKTHPVSIKIKKTLWTAHEELKDFSTILVEVRTDDGLTGVGQIHGSPMKSICEWVARLADVIRGMEATNTVTAWEKMFSLTSPRPNGMGGRDGQPAPFVRSARPQVMSAIAGIDIALWDIRGKAAGLPVYRLLGAEKRPLFTYATGGYYQLGEPNKVYADELASFVKAGFKAVKLKTGGFAVKEEAKRVAEVRAAIGKDTLLMLDMNAPYDIDDCIAFARAVEPSNIFWLEEPLHWYLQPADFVRLAQATHIPLAHGERELTRFTVRDFIASGAIRYVQFDSTRYAGFTEALRVAQLAEQHGVMIAPHTVPEIHGHLLMAFPRCGYAVESHGNEERDPISHHLYKEPVETKDSYVYLNDKPGFGVEIDWDFVKKHPA
jgi:L-alanine-DL-glutamate epimerase-like enolase superfamily enzyme